jgi:restriction system protein
MQALIAIFTIIYLLWPLILVLGIRKLFTKNLTIIERIRLAIQKVFFAWIFMALALAFITWHGREPILLLPSGVNHILFFGTGILTGGITLIWTFHLWQKRRISFSNARRLEDLLALSPGEFEKLVATLFKAYGHQAQVLGGTSDHGVDIVVLSVENEKWVVQCKRYNGSVGEPVVRDLYGTMGHEGAHRAYLITTGTFTSQAREWAVGKPIVLYDGEALVKLIQRTKIHRSQLRI